jgi:DNA-directed RNA polymerase specialized sigma24 family protein
MANDYNEDEVKRLVTGSHVEQKKALETLFDRYSEPLWCFLCDHFPSLGADEIGGVVDQVFIAVWNKINSDPFCLDKPITRFLFDVARNKAIDCCRRSSRRIDRVVNDSGKPTENGEQTDVGEYRRKITSEQKAKEIHAMFCQLAVSLPDFQRLVATIMAENFPLGIGQSGTADEVFRRTGERPTLASIKRARSEIRRKFKKVLMQKGGRTE